MKARKLFLWVAVVAAMTSGLMVACNKHFDRKSDGRALTAGALAVCDCPAASTTDSVINTNIAANLRLSNAKRYKLAGLIFVTNNAVLTIDSGTTIMGVKATSPAVGGGLVITRGAKIVANGTPSCPIIFTSDQAAKTSGDWCGVVILGKAETNNYPSTVEGINSASYPGIDLTYGSADSLNNSDNSGVLRFVRIEYAGYALSTNNEINGLTLAGVGRGTTIDYVEVFKANDDAFEFFGGCVNASHLIAVDPLDDMFDTDNGYTGTIRFALGLADTSRKDQSRSNGFESDNNAGGTAATPITHPHYHYVTIVGVKDSAQAHSQIVTGGGQVLRYGRAGLFKNNTRFSIDSSIVFGYTYGISIDSGFQIPGVIESLVEWNAGRSTLFKVFSAGYGSTTTGTVAAWAKEVGGNVSSSPFLITPQNLGMYAPANGNPFGLNNPYARPAFASNASITNWVTSSLLPTDSLKIYGAFPAKIDWTRSSACTNNWTRYKD